MAKEDLGKLSTEQLKKLASTISEAKSLTNQQAEIIEKVLAGEADIGKLRISYLEQYFDKYSKELDKVARKHSTLNDAFLVLDNKLTENYKTLSSDVGKLVKQLERVSKAAAGGKSADSSKEAGKQAGGATKALSGMAKDVNSILQVLRSGVHLNKEQYQTLLARTADILTSASNSTTSTSPSSPIQYSANSTSGTTNSDESFQEAVRGALDLINTLYDRSIPVSTATIGYESDHVSGLIAAIEESSTTASGASAKLPPTTPPVTHQEQTPLPTDSDADGGQEANLAGLKKTHQDILNFLDEIAKDGIAAYTQEAEIKARQSAQNEKQLKNWADKEETIRNSMLDLAIAKLQTQEELENRSIEVRLTRLKEATDAELELQNKLNSIASEIAFANSHEAADVAVKESTAKDTLASAKELAKQRADYIAAEELKAKLANDGILKEADAARIREEADEKFKFDQENLAKITTERLKAEQRVKELGNNPQLSKAREEEMAKYRAKLELASRQANNGILTAEEAERIKGLVEERYELEGKEMEKLAKKQLKEDERKAKDDKRKEKQDSRKKIDDVASAPLSKDNNLIDHFTALKQATEDKVTNVDGDPKNEKVAKAIAGLDTAMTLMSDLAKKLEGKIDEIAKYQGGIDTRLQGSNNKTSSGSYWNQLTKDMMSVGAFTPFFKQETFANNIKTLVDQGIAFDLKQRAFLMTIQEKIATTFNVADGTLLRLIRIQQEDSTAGRLGMESALNSFLNNMYENTEYLKTVADGVRGSLEEMESLMSGAEATEIEYQVQKWMGSLYSVGMSQTAVQGIASSLGQIAAGQIEGLMGGNGAGNLLVMAANNAGLSIADVLTDGLNADKTNKLLQATVNYLAEIAESSKDNNVVQQQLANVFGVKASDLRAAVNLVEPGTVSDIYGNYKTYDNMLKQLNNMAGSMYKRTSIGEMMTNIWENGQYSIASSIANSPISYLTYKLAGLLDSAVGGIDLPFLNVMGFGVDLNTTVSDLMRIASVGAGLLGSLGPMISGLASSFNGKRMLTTMGIKSGNGLAVTPRGEDGGGIGGGGNVGGGNESTSGSGYVGNSSSSDVKNSTIQESEDSKKKQMVEAKEEEPTNQVDVLNNYVIKIYELLEGVTKGSQTLRVRVDSYGLTGTNGHGGGAQGGSSGLLGTSSGSNSLGGGSVSAGGSAGTADGSGSTGSSFSSGAAIDLGGWTMM